MKTTTTFSSSGHHAQSRIKAVIELGSTSIRMVIAEENIARNGKLKILDQLQQTVSLGRDSFRTGKIAPDTIEACVSAVKSFRGVMQEYGITDQKAIRAIASSAVREARNQGALLDRILLTTGISVDVIDAAEVNRLTYSAIRPVLARQSYFLKKNTLVIEVGGGSTEALMFHRGRVTSSHMYRMGSLRLLQSVEAMGIPRSREIIVIRDSIDQTIREIKESILPASPLVMVVLGAEMRFAAKCLYPDWDHHTPISLNTEALANLSRQMNVLQDDEIAQKYLLPIEEAETIRPALMIVARLAEALPLTRLVVTDVNLRSGLLAEMRAGGNWTRSFKQQIINSALDVAKRYEVNSRHARNVKTYALELMRHLRKQYDFSPRDEMILTVACLLHEIGRFVHESAHHKHSYYLISNCDLFGLGAHETELAALVARYHRRSDPKATHSSFMAQSRDDRLTIKKLSALLRVANALDRFKEKRPLRLHFKQSDGLLTITTSALGSMPVLQRRLQTQARLFQEVYGCKIVLRQQEKE